MRLLITGGAGFIGTNAVEWFQPRTQELLFLDRHPPQVAAHRPWGCLADLKDRDRLLRLVRDFQPTHVLHLAARAECVETTTVEEGYRDNTEGTANLLAALQKCPTVRRAIITSSQYVCGPGCQPRTDEEVCPVTVYGASKVITERLTRSARLPFCWTLTRPTNVWGPWHARYEKEFWRVARRGFYFHPGGAPVRRAYGYVGNVLAQMAKIFTMPEPAVHGRTFYLGDETDDIWNWAVGFCRALGGRTPPRIPRPVLRLMGLAGDTISGLTGRRFYIDSTRVKSMTTDYPIDMTETFRVLGRGPFSLDQGIAETTRWLAKERGWPLPEVLSSKNQNRV